MLKNPVIRYDFKLNVIRRIFTGKVDDMTQRFFELVCKKNRAEILPAVASVFLDLYNEAKGIVLAKITTAMAMSDDMRAQFEALLKGEGKEVRIEEEVDERIIGGFVLQIGDNQADNSISSKLKNLKRELTKD
jgi:F-type H+-transporting ATPase subunit delta